MKLSRITALEIGKLNEEHILLTNQITELSKIMHDDSSVYEIMTKETVELRDKFGKNRLTKICDEEEVITDIDLVPNER